MQILVTEWQKISPNNECHSFGGKTNTNDRKMITKWATNQTTVMIILFIIREKNVEHNFHIYLIADSLIESMIERRIIQRQRSLLAIQSVHCRPLLKALAMLFHIQSSLFNQIIHCFGDKEWKRMEIFGRKG